MKIIIPARQGSKGLPFKNRKLLDYTIDKIPQKYFKDTYVTTDDETILEKISFKGLNGIKRSRELSEDTVSIKPVMADVVKKLDLDETEMIVMLYLTYPQRSWEEIESAIAFLKENKAKSLLCRKELKVSPYLCMIENGLKGEQLIKHDLYRRQDYPNCFEISHFICIFEVSELNNLNKNMYNHDTVFYKIGEVVDVDELTDIEKFYDKRRK
tara:strand:- start:5883 stop:6518 length:636 start_codon:yes stop_codon:yes gene_type:complete